MRTAARLSLGSEVLLRAALERHGQFSVLIIVVKA